MKMLVQRVSEASVTIDNKVKSSIKQGYLVLFGVEKGDTKDKADFLAKKLVNLRVFTDENDKMNLSIKDIRGEIIIVSQFTLAGDCTRGNRPGFENAAKPDEAIPLYEYFIKLVEAEGVKVGTGEFGADMKVALINDGPVTFMIEK